MRKTLFRVLVVFFFLLACQTSEEEKIHQTLTRREEAFQKKDLSLYLSCISRNYQDKNEDFDRLRARMEGYFKTFDRIEYSSRDRSLHISGNEAAVVQQFQMVVEKGEKKNRYSGKEFLFLKKEGGTWKIDRGL
jgi:hypothetical protein